jgi:IS30 family transposase
MVTLVERHARYTLACVLPNRQAAPVSAALIEMLCPYKPSCQTLTFDNGKEFADHAFFGACLQADVYFAHPTTPGGAAPARTPTGCCASMFPSA